MESNFDFGGWATRGNVKCSDGLTIQKDAFKHCDGLTVPLVWGHIHNQPEAVLGHALLESRDGDIYAHCSFNDTDSGKNAKMLVQHGDVVALSIYANQLQKQGNLVQHGNIREVSLVLASANPSAFIREVLAHGDGAETDEAVIYTGEGLTLAHTDESEEPPMVELEEKPEEKSEEKPEEGTLEHTDENKGETVADVFNTLTEKQKTVVYYMLGDALGQSGNDETEPTKTEEDTTVKHNVFDQDEAQKDTFISHADQMKILTSAKLSTVGSLRAAIDLFVGSNEDLKHADLGINGITTLFPDYQDVRPGAPELLTTDQGWITRVLAKVHKSPISRIRTRQADVRNIAAMRAKGYVKGNEKTYVGNIGLVNRTTDPQTVYVKSKLERDDIVDIVDFDVVAYMYGIDRMNLNEELATAIMIGDGREDGADGKIYPDKIRPIWHDDELYTLHADVDIATMRAELQGTDTAAQFGDNYVYAEAIIQTLLYTREKYKGSGSPDMYCTPHLLNVMLLARDRNGRRVYENINELKAVLNVAEIVTAEQFADKTRITTDNKTKKLLALIVNLDDYHLGATKGGEITHFTDFDIDFNQEKSLLETRCSGANTRVLSAIALEQDVTVPA
jgi:hypothetical protein